MASPAGSGIRPTPYPSQRGQWDAETVYKPFAIFDGRRWLLWYNGRKGDCEQIGVAIHEGEGLGFQETIDPK
jgi:hypothetical protein